MAEPAAPIEPAPPPPVSKITLVGAGLFVIALVVLLLKIPDSNPAVDPAETDAAKIFASNCAVCHGPGGHGKLTFPKIAGTPKSEEEIVRLLETGKGKMPALSGATLGQREALAKYVKGLK
jgi:mono/diheme cytochrome c family protein